MSQPVGEIAGPGDVMTTAETIALWGAIGQVAAAVLAIVAIVVTARIAIVDRRRADQQAELDRQLAREAEERRWERDLLIRLSIALEASASSEGRSRGDPRAWAEPTS